MMKTLKKLVLPLYKKYRFLGYFKNDRSKLSFLKRLWCLRKGFFPRNYILYEFPKNDYRDYITDYEEYARLDHINQETSYINNKVLFTELMNTHVEMPAILGLIIEGKWSVYKNSSLDNFEKLLMQIARTQGVILKPIMGDGGIGIFKITATENDYLLNQEVYSKNDLTSFLKTLNGYYVSELVEQHAYADLIYPKSVNTIRILTMIDPKTKEAFIAAASHRIGNERSFPVDNCAKGGFTAEISIENGEIGSAVRTYFKDDKPRYFEQHPDSGSQIKKTKIQHWEYIKEKTLELAKAFEFLPYLAWDIVLLPTGKITILEANDGADLKLHQVHAPLLKNDRVKQFYSYYNVR